MSMPASQPAQYNESSDNNHLSAPQQPHRQLKVEDALAYLDQVRDAYQDDPRTYNRFLDIMKEFKAKTIDTPGVINSVFKLFEGRRDLIMGFNTFLPPGYRIVFGNNGASIDYPARTTGPQPSDFSAAPASEGLSGGAPAAAASGRLFGGASAAPASKAAAPVVRRKAPIGFDEAINFVTKVKTRFTKQPETYKAFLEILHMYQKEQKSIKEVYVEVSALFEGHLDLVIGFTNVLPDGYSCHNSIYRNMAKWRMATRVIGKLMLSYRRAAERAYAPGGVGYIECHDEFEALAKHPI